MNLHPCFFLYLLHNISSIKHRKDRSVIYSLKIEWLTAELLNTLIEKITVHEAVKGEDGSREQEVEVYYRFIGKID